jgi:hypothetical protein
MAEIKVCIEIDEDGTISVGAEPPEAGDDAEAADAGQTPGMTDLAAPQGGEEGAEKSYMEPVKSIDEALSVARDLLRNAAQVGGATIGGDASDPAMQDSADAAFKSRRGAKAY